MDRKPLIGVTAYEVPASFGHWVDVQTVMAPSTYTRSVLRAGGLPVVVPPMEGVEQVLDVLDGIVFTGGSDIDPRVYGQEQSEATTGVYRHRDDSELALMQAALDRDLPMLAICRGMQLLNVARGGDLHQHLPDVIPGSEKHRGQPGRFAEHEVVVEPGTRLASVLGSTVHTHSFHHQAPDRIGDGLTVSAVADDGSVEGIEDPGKTYTVGVLWHPEESVEGGAPLFRELVERARDRGRTTA
jgi:gamma-glutamyl-gamma-aminobutyrate hydrolase PuuD